MSFYPMLSEFLNVTTTVGHQDPPLPQYVGYIGCVMAAIFFGSNFIPIKKYETGDGLFFQLMLCIAIWFCSVILHAVRGFPRFWPLAMLGGFCWCTGNLMAVPVVQSIGLAMGILIWGTTNMLFGWASGRFGWFGLDPQVPGDTTLNYIGVATCIVSAIFVSMIKPHIEGPGSRSDSSSDGHGEAERDPLIPPFSGDVGSEEAVITGSRKSYGSSTPTNSSASSSSYTDGVAGDVSFQTNRTAWFKRHLWRAVTSRQFRGIIMALVSGALYGVNFAPVIYIKNNYPKYYGNCTEDPCLEKVSQKDIDYVFSHFTGILVTSLLYFTIYCAVKKNSPVVYPKVMLPAIISGVMWAIADISFFIANECLDESVSFPIINAGPAVVAALWGVFLFREIQGKRNLLLLLIAFCFTTGGCVMCGLSK